MIRICSSFEILKDYCTPPIALMLLMLRFLRATIVLVHETIRICAILPLAHPQKFKYSKFLTILKILYP